MAGSVLRVPVEGLSAGLTALPEEASRYVVKVHRQGEGDELLLFDPVAGLEAPATLLSDRLPCVRVELGELILAPRAEMRVTLLQAVGKGDKPEQAVKDATAFGAESVVFLHTARSVAKSEGPGRKERLTRVAAQVARQCGRGALPEVTGPISFDEGLSERDVRELKLACVWHESAVPLAKAVERHDFEDVSLSVLVGPEGGLNPDEVASALEAGFQPVSLGPYVLRAETAAGAVLSTLRFISDAKKS